MTFHLFLYISAKITQYVMTYLKNRVGTVRVCNATTCSQKVSTARTYYTDEQFLLSRSNNNNDASWIQEVSWLRLLLRRTRELTIILFAPEELRKRFLWWFLAGSFSAKKFREVPFWLVARSLGGGGGGEQRSLHRGRRPGGGARRQLKSCWERKPANFKWIAAAAAAAAAAAFSSQKLREVFLGFVLLV